MFSSLFLFYRFSENFSLADLSDNYNLLRAGIANIFPRFLVTFSTGTRNIEFIIIFLRRPIISLYFERRINFLLPKYKAQQFLTRRTSASCFSGIRSLHQLKGRFTKNKQPLPFIAAFFPRQIELLRFKRSYAEQYFFPGKKRLVVERALISFLFSRFLCFFSYVPFVPPYK